MNFSKKEKLRPANAEQARTRKTSPERALLCAMINRALLDLGSRSAELRRSARTWILSPRKTAFSFRWTCEQLELGRHDTIQAILKGLD